MADSVVSNPIRAHLGVSKLSDDALLMFNSAADDDIHPQPYSPMLSAPHEIIAIIIELAVNRVSPEITLAAIMCIVNCAAACKQLRKATRLVQTAIDASTFIMIKALGACPGDPNLNGHRMHVHKLEGGLILRANAVSHRLTDSGELDSNGTSVIIVRDCDTTTKRFPGRSTYGAIHILLAVPKAKPCESLDDFNCGYTALSLTIDEGLRLLSGDHLNKSIAHPVTKWVRKQANQLVNWPIHGFTQEEKAAFVYDTSEKAEVADESAVEIRAVRSGVRGIRGLLIVTTKSASPVLSEVAVVVPSTTHDGVEYSNQLATFFNSELPLDVSRCRFSFLGQTKSIIDINTTVDAPPLPDTLKAISKANIIPNGKRRAAVVQADRLVRQRVAEEMGLTETGKMTPQHPLYEPYKKSAKASGMEDDQLAAEASTSY